MIVIAPLVFHRGGTGIPTEGLATCLTHVSRRSDA
jgi:hypothetical protein